MIFSSFSAIPLFFVILLLLEAGDAALGARTGLELSTTIENADFPLFCWRRAVGRFDTHRSVIADELKTIETAYRRLDPLSVGDSATYPPALSRLRHVSPESIRNGRALVKQSRNIIAFPKVNLSITQKILRIAVGGVSGRTGYCP